MFTHKQVLSIIIILCAVNVEISRSSNIAQTVNRLTASNMSLTLVTNVGRSDDKRPYLSSSLIEVCPFENRPCHLNINARLHYNFTFGHLLILAVFLILHTELYHCSCFDVTPWRHFFPK